MSIKVGIMGLGTVGGGVVKLLKNKALDFKKLLGDEIICYKTFSRRSNRLRELGLKKSDYTNDLNLFLKEDFDIVVETIGGDFPKKAMLQLLNKGVKVVTANKYLLATKTSEIFHKDTCESLFFEASCCGAIPIISSLEEGLQSNDINSLMGIFNGTCNYILSEMSQNGSDFETVLKEAQKLGYAEADPTFDIDGIDASHKLSLLSSLSFSKQVPFDLIHSEGIRMVKPEDFSWANSNGYVIKLISMAETKSKNEIFLGTFPMLIKKTHPLSNVNGAYNAVFVHGDSAGDLMYYGSGAGEMPTASAIVSDVIAAAQNKLRIRSKHVFADSKPFKKINVDREFGYYIRIKTLDQPGVMEKLCSAFAKSGISLVFVHQTPSSDKKASIVFTTYPTTDKNVKKAISNMNSKKLLIDKPLLIRILEI
jgi:homoserine dehydrogenase